MRFLVGGPTRIRTWDQPVMSRWLYQLSYRPVVANKRLVYVLTKGMSRHFFLFCD